MFSRKPFIYHLINKHNRKFNPNKLFLSKNLRKRDEWFTNKVFVPFFVIAATSATILIFLIRGKCYQIFGVICILLILIVLFSYNYIYFNYRAKKETGYKFQRNKIVDFFKWWITPKYRKEQLSKIRKHYTDIEFHSLIESAQLEYDFQKGKIGMLHFEAMFISILAVILTLSIELGIIKDWLLELNKGQKLTFDENYFVFKTVVGIIILFLIAYGYLRWSINQGYRDKKNKLRYFMQTMLLAKGIKVKKNNFKNIDNDSLKEDLE